MAIQFCRKAKQTPQGVLTTLHYALSVAYMVKETVRNNAPYGVVTSKRVIIKLPRFGLRPNLVMTQNFVSLPEIGRNAFRLPEKTEKLFIWRSENPRINI